VADDKTTLLRSLEIDRSGAEAARRGGRAWPIAFGLVTAAALGIGGFVFLSGTIERSGPAAPAPPVRQAAAAPSPARTSDPRPQGLVASGYVVARRKATVAAEITGKVVEVLIEEGMVVQQGQVVARLDSVLAEKDLALAYSRGKAAEAAVAAITADLRDAERIYTRAQTLAQRQIASEADLTKAEARLGVLRAQLQQAEAQLNTAGVDAERTAALLEKHSIRAPFGGVVIDRTAQPGEMISPLSVGGFTRTGICTIVDMDSIEFEVDVNEAFISRVRAGTPVSAVLDAYPDWTIPASVIAVVPSANREKATVRVRIGLDRKDPRVLPDMAVKVTFMGDATAGEVRDRATAAN
jgi:HlyD family secretion protein